MVNSTLSEIYNVPQRVFNNIIYFGSSNGKEIAQYNITRFLSHPYISEILLKSRDVSFISRNDKYQAHKKFNETLEDISQEIASYFQHQNDFQRIHTFPKAIEEIATYKTQTPTNESIQLRNCLLEILLKYKKKFGRNQIVPILYGSVLYGDAHHGSDIDLSLICFDGITDTHINISDNFIEDLGDLSRDIECEKPESILVDGLELNALLEDIIAQDTTDINDYAFGDCNCPQTIYHAFNRYVEGKPIFKQEIKFQKLQEKIINAVHKDPFFEFLLLYNFYNSFQKREERRK